MLEIIVIFMRVCVCSYRFVSVKMMARRHKNYASCQHQTGTVQRLIDRSYTATLASQIFQTYRSPSPSILSLLNTWLASLEEIARKQISWWPWWWRDWRTDGLDIGDNRTWEQCCIDSEEDSQEDRLVLHNNTFTLIIIKINFVFII